MSHISTHLDPVRLADLARDPNHSRCHATAQAAHAALQAAQAARPGLTFAAAQGERRAVPQPPPAPASRLDKIIAAGDAKRRAYLDTHHAADTAMAYGAQISWLHGQVRILCAEAEALNVVRDAQLDYLTVSAPDFSCDLTVGFTYEPGEPDRITSAQHCEKTGDPGHPGCAEELEIQEVWVNGADVAHVLTESATESITESVLAKIHALQTKGREMDDPA